MSGSPAAQLALPVDHYPLSWSGRISFTRERPGVYRVNGIGGLPDLPRGGYVYAITAMDAVMYVGAATNPHRRLRDHLFPAGHRGWGYSPIAELASHHPDLFTSWHVDVHDGQGDAGAEAWMIRTLRPCLNIKHNPSPRSFPEPLATREATRRRRVTAELVKTLGWDNERQERQ